MNAQAPNTYLVPKSRQELQELIESMSASDRAQLSADWLARFNASTETDPWVHGFRVVHRDTGMAVGTCAFKGPPMNGVVEIAYGIAPEHRGLGYATEAAQALFEYAAATGDVRIVRAHTLPDGDASKRVLAKCGFRYIGEVIEPEDGLVWRFEKSIC